MELTVVVFHYMREESLRNCLRHLEENTVTPYRLVVMREDGERMPIGEKKAKMMEHIDTPYFTKLDNDMMVKRFAIDYQLQTIKLHEELGACSGLIKQNGCVPKHVGIGDLKRVGNYIIRIRPKISKFNRENIVYGDYFPEGATTYRTEAFQTIHFDPLYDIGYSHWDTITQFWLSGWRTAIDLRSVINHVHPYDKYAQWKKSQRTAFKQSRRRFIEKWGLRPVEYNERTPPGIFLHGLVTLKEIVE